jgi:hypothetical protein
VPTRRTVIDRRRTPVITRETLSLFQRLDETPPRQRRSKAFREAADRLHEQLGLHSEYFLSGHGADVLDDGECPFRPPQYHVVSWQACRDVRERLLAMLLAAG